MWLVEMAISTNHMSKIRVKNTEHTAVESQKEITAYFKFQIQVFQLSNYCVLTNHFAEQCAARL